MVKKKTKSGEHFGKQRGDSGGLVSRAEVGANTRPRTRGNKTSESPFSAQTPVRKVRPGPEDPGRAAEEVGGEGSRLRGAGLGARGRGLRHLHRREQQPRAAAPRQPPPTRPRRR